MLVLCSCAGDDNPVKPKDDFKQVPVSFSLNYKIWGYLNGNLTSKSYGTYEPGIKSWSFDVKVPSKLIYEVYMSAVVSTDNKRLEWTDKYNGRQCNFIGDFKVKDGATYTAKETFNNTRDNDLMKYITFTHSSSNTDSDEGKFEFSSEIPSLEQINKIVSDHGINPYTKYLLADLYLTVPFQLIVEIYDASTNELIETKVIDEIQKVYVGAKITCYYK